MNSAITKAYPNAASFTIIQAYTKQAGWSEWDLYGGMTLQQAADMDAESVCVDVRDKDGNKIAWADFKVSELLEGTVRVRKVNVSAIEKGIDFADLNDHDKTFRAGKSWIEGKAKDLIALALEADAMAEENAPATMNDYDCPPHLYEIVAEKMVAATERAARKILEQI